jgi:hypothetical protein
MIKQAKCACDVTRDESKHVRSFRDLLAGTGRYAGHEVRGDEGADGDSALARLTEVHGLLESENEAAVEQGHGKIMQL